MPHENRQEFVDLVSNAELTAISSTAHRGQEWLEINNAIVELASSGLA